MGRMLLQWNHKIFGVEQNSFESLALEIFQFQYGNNPVYKAFADALQKDQGTVQSVTEIPFLPVEFFKSHMVKTTSFEPEIVFESSGTTSKLTGKHFVKEPAYYEESFTKGFEFFYGPVKDYCILCLLPSYLERGNSSLVYMADKLIRQSGHPQSAFYLHDTDRLASVLKEVEEKQQKIILLGVLFALLDFAEKFPMPLKNTQVMETGGMKGRRKELIRSEAHDILKKNFDLPAIHSEYGMTEMLSQAYSKSNGIFQAPPWLRVLVRDEADPLQVTTDGKGAINIIDLANVYSCSFIATDDAGIVYKDGSFEVSGRMDNSDLRGCSLMVV